MVIMFGGGAGLRTWCPVPSGMSMTPKERERLARDGRACEQAGTADMSTRVMLTAGAEGGEPGMWKLRSNDRKLGVSSRLALGGDGMWSTWRFAPASWWHEPASCWAGARA